MKVLLLLLCLVPCSTMAGIYQCKDPDGRTVFSDQPCEHGINKEMPEYETILEPFVSGRVTLNNKGFPLRNGLILWNKANHELLLILTKQPINETESQQAILSDWTFLDRHKLLGLSKITLSFKSNNLSLKNLRNMRSEFFTVNEDPTKPWTTNHGGGDVVGHINKLELFNDQNKRWLAFSSQELTPDIRWNMNLVLPISMQTAPDKK